MDPAPIPHMKQSELVRSALITFSIPVLVNISHVSIDASTIPLLYTPTCTNPHRFPYPMSFSATCEQQFAHENMNSSTSPETKLIARAEPQVRLTTGTRIEPMQTLPIAGFLANVCPCEAREAQEYEEGFELCCGRGGSPDPGHQESGIERANECGCWY